jgi:aryl-alcohol dehydrogenase-like predicted oxidoreductase
MSGPPASRDDAEAIATITAALDAGVTFLDTGDYYGAGHNEMLVGQAIKGRREKAFLSVKFGAMRSASGAFLGIDVRPAAVKNFAAYSLQRLGVDVIDLYQPGRLDPSIPVEETVGAVADLITEGRVRYLGLSEANASNCAPHTTSIPSPHWKSSTPWRPASSNRKSCRPHPKSENR